MTEHAAFTVAHTSLLAHPAIVAWSKLWPAVEPQRVVILKPDSKRSAVYRLGNAGPEGSSVIAKRGRAARIAIELTIYREILLHVPLHTLRCYGSVADPDQRFSWLFLDDAGEERYSSSNEEHRTLAAQWLAALHTFATPPATRASLPHRGLNHYRYIVWQARETVMRTRANPAFSATDLATLNAIVSHCAVLASHWRQVEEICEVMPRTIVHGDFSAKNVRIRQSPNGLDVIPLDWDGAGWGVAAADLSQTAVAVYWSSVRQYWPRLSLDAVRRFANVGRMFWNLDPITGEAETLASEWVSNVMRKMNAYEAELASALRATGWGN